MNFRAMRQGKNLYSRVRWHSITFENHTSLGAACLNCYLPWISQQTERLGSNCAWQHMFLFYISFSAQCKVGHRRCRNFLAVEPNASLGRRKNSVQKRCFFYSLSLKKVSAKYKVRTKPVKESSAERASIFLWTGASSISCSASWSNLAFASCTFREEETFWQSSKQIGRRVKQQEWKQ